MAWFWLGPTTQPPLELEAPAEEEDTAAVEVAVDDDTDDGPDDDDNGGGSTIPEDEAPPTDDAPPEPESDDTTEAALDPKLPERELPDVTSVLDVVEEPVGCELAVEVPLFDDTPWLEPTAPLDELPPVMRVRQAPSTHASPPAQSKLLLHSLTQAPSSLRSLSPHRLLQPDSHTSRPSAPAVTRMDVVGLTFGTIADTHLPAAFVAG